ncbi:MAG: hypothetical protein ACYCSD_10945 [Acidiferrobacteraceae bacterium]
MAATRHEAWGNAREPGGDTPGRLRFDKGDIHCTVNIAETAND